MELFLQALRKNIKGEVTTSSESRRLVSTDASIYELKPDVVVRPKGTEDVSELVKLVIKHKSNLPKLAITPRGAGTDMTGGAIGDSIILDTTSGLNSEPKLRGTKLYTQPGVFLRDLDPILGKSNLHIGCAPASRNLCTIGGVVANNSGGEYSLRHGNANNSVRELTVVLDDGNPYKIKPLSKKQLDQKMKGSTYEAKLYRQIFNLIESNYDAIRNARPRTSKNAMGYNLWSVWDRDTGVFDLTQLFTGSQGTLGIITDIVIEAAPRPTNSVIMVAYLPASKNLGRVLTTVTNHRPASFEGFDDITFSVGLKNFKTFKKQLGAKDYLKQQAKYVTSFFKITNKAPNMALTIEVDGRTDSESYKKASDLYDDLINLGVKVDIETDNKTKSYIKELSKKPVSLVRSQIKGRHAISYLDDMVVPAHLISEFIPAVRRILKKNRLPAVLQGHLGDGNLHVTPLVDLSSPSDQARLEKAMRELIPAITKYGGTMTGEHNDGMIRGPWLPVVFGKEVYDLFRQTKEIFDPNYIFNPYKKTDASLDFSMSHVKEYRGKSLTKKH